MIGYEFTKYADQQLSKLPTEIQERIIKKIRFYLRAPDPLDFAKFIRRRKEISIYRFRIGDWRVIFEWGKEKILITQIRPRGFKKIYK